MIDENRHKTYINENQLGLRWSNQIWLWPTCLWFIPLLLFSGFLFRPFISLSESLLRFLNMVSSHQLGSTYTSYIADNFTLTKKEGKVL